MHLSSVLRLPLFLLVSGDGLASADADNIADLRKGRMGKRGAVHIPTILHCGGVSTKNISSMLRDHLDLLPCSQLA